MSDTTTPYVSDEQIEKRCLFINSIAPDNDEVSWIGAAEWMRDLYESHVQQLVRERDEALAKVAWISVRDCPYPPDRRAVLVWCPERMNIYACTMDIRKSSKWHFFAAGGDVLNESVTHWMPLPSPPNTPPSNG